MSLLFQYDKWTLVHQPASYAGLQIFLSDNQHCPFRFLFLLILYIKLQEPISIFRQFFIFFYNKEMKKTHPSIPAHRHYLTANASANYRVSPV